MSIRPSLICQACPYKRTPPCMGELFVLWRLLRYKPAAARIPHLGFLSQEHSYSFFSRVFHDGSLVVCDFRNPKSHLGGPPWLHSDVGSASCRNKTATVIQKLSDAASKGHAPAHVVRRAAAPNRQGSVADAAAFGHG